MQQLKKLFTVSISVAITFSMLFSMNSIVLAAPAAVSNTTTAIGDDTMKDTLPTENTPLQVEPIIPVYEPPSDISLAPTLAAEIKQLTDFDMLKGALPATVILHVDKNLNILDSSNQVIGTVTDALRLLNNKIIPAFYVKDMETVTSLTAYILQNAIIDAFVMSDDPNLVKEARAKAPKIRGIVDFYIDGEITNDSLLNIRTNTNSSGAKIAVLPQSAATKENVEYLQKRLITVWVKTESNIVKQAEIVEVLTTGINGIITDSYQKYIDAFALFKGKGSILRKPFIIGHRGVPSLAPENTLEGAKKAYELGADIIENDIYLSKDNEIVIMHDSTVNSTTNGTGNIEDFTLAEIKQLKLKQFASTYPDAKVPALKEYFEYFKDKDIVHFIEIKSRRPEIVDALKNLMQEYGVEDQCVVISFIPEQLKNVHDKMPGISVGYLCNDSWGSQPSNDRLTTALSTVLDLNSTINPGYYGLDQAFMEAVKHRGITIWPWTLNNQTDFNTYFLFGTYGLTTNFSQWTSSYAEEIVPQSDTYTLYKNTKTKLKADIITYDGKTQVKPVEVVIIEGDNILQVDGINIKAKETGTAKVMLKYANPVSGGRYYYIYSKPVTIRVIKKSKI